MKKLISLTLLLCMILTLSACGKVEVTVQEIYDAGQTEALLKNHQSIYIRDEMDGEVWRETYLTKDYFYDYIPDEEADWVEFITDDASYHYMNGDYLRYVAITPDGVSDFASLRAERSATADLSVEVEDYTIESVSEKDGRISVKTVLSQDVLAAEMEEYGLLSAETEYVLDAKTHEIISRIGDYTYDDGTAFHVVAEATYDAEAPEMVKTFLEYANQTENLRNVTIVSNPGTEKEESKSIQAPKGLIIGLQYEEEDYVFEVYTDADCTEAYDPYESTDSDLTIYVKCNQ